VDETRKRELFDQICERNERRLHSIAQTYARGDDVRDLYQEILLEIWLSLPSFQGRSEIDTWVYRVALNTAKHLSGQGNQSG
jgi:RNA polymerase sigma-70 factor (ECF subfamily)